MSLFNLHGQSDIHKVLKSITEQPGVYKFFDIHKNIIYVGKAKNLQKRIRSYFQKEHDNARIRLLVKKIHAVETIVVENEHDAFILENTLIKQYQPRYNIRLKDDKSYPWICISREPYPRIFVEHQPDHHKNECYGPYPSYRSMYAVLDIVRNTYPIRTCKLPLSEKTINAGKYRVCLEFHIKKCKGPCEGKITLEEYQQYIQKARKIIQGELQDIIQDLKKEMKLLSDQLLFEKAQEVKEKIELLQSYQAKSVVVDPSIQSCDVVSVAHDAEDGLIVANFMRIRKGAIIHASNQIVEAKYEDSLQNAFDHILYDINAKLNGFSAEVIVPFYPAVHFQGVRFTVPRKGNKKEVLLLSEKNARIALIEHKKMRQPDEEQVPVVLEELKQILSISELPVHIEAFDNSNLQGTEAVSACVVFRNGRPSPSEYRHFLVKTVEGPDDYATISEVVYRRYKRLLDEQQSLPQVILIDGGKGQVEAAARSLEKLGILHQVKLLGIAKRLESVFVYGDHLPLYVDKRSGVLRLLQHLRDEAHRFGLKHHRHRREKKLVQTSLTQIKGIGPATARKLLEYFGSIENIKKASFAEVAAIIGSQKATVIKNELLNNYDNVAD